MSLWETISTIKHKKSLSGHICKLKNKYKETSQCILQKASFTLEAVVIIPLVTGVFVTILFFFQILYIEGKVDEALMYAGRKVAVESSITNSNEALFLSAKALVTKVLYQYPEVNHNLKHGVLGISLLESDFSGKRIKLCASYKIKLPVSCFGMDAVEVYQTNSFQKWRGDGSKNKDESWVYVTEYGRVYHRSLNCRVLALKIKDISYKRIKNLRGKDGQKYYPCKQCIKEGFLTENSRVYYTDYGVLYHLRGNCSALKRTIERVPLSEVEEVPECHFCGE